MSIYEPIESTDTARRVYQLRSPIDLQPTDELVCANEDDVKAALARAREVQPAWAATPVKQRAEVLSRAVKIMLARQDEIVDTVVKETGKSRSDALAMEVYSPCDAATYYAKQAPKALADEKRAVPGIMKLTKKLRIVYKPLGVVGVIVPWNGPFVLGMVPSMQALVAGNAVLLKGSEVTPYSTALVESIFKEAGLPDGVLQNIMGDGQTGAALVECGVDKIAFTGSVRTGRIVAESCGRQLIPCSLELGGKDAMIVCADAAIDRAVQGAIAGSCMNTGHYCCGTERIYVVEQVYDEFLEKVIEGTKALRQGNQLGFDEDVGAVFWDRQMTIIEEHVDDARANGATIHCGGERNTELPGLYYKPTVVTGVNHDMKIMREETFGPVLCVVKVKDEEEALRLANDSDYGLNGNVWTKDVDRGIALATRIDTGGVSVNDIAVAYGINSAPFGGRKASGVGQVNGIAGLRSYTFSQPIISDKSSGNLQGAYPKKAEDAEGMKKFMSFMWEKTPLGRWLS